MDQLRSLRVTVVVAPERSIERMMRMIKRMTCLVGLAMFLAACSARARSPRAANELTGDAPANARAEIMPLFERMLSAANDHDVDGHLALYAREPTLMFVINDEAIRGWDALREQQRRWWQGGKTDVAYELAGDPVFQMPAPGLVVQTYFLTSHRSLANGETREGRLAVTDLWQKRPEGWRIIYAHESGGSR